MPKPRPPRSRSRKWSATSAVLPASTPQRDLQDPRPTAFCVARQGVHDASPAPYISPNTPMARTQQMGALLAGLCLRSRHHGAVPAVLQAVQARRRSDHRCLAQARPTRLHRSHHQADPGQAAGAVYAALCGRSLGLREPGQHLGAVLADGGGDAQRRLTCAGRRQKSAGRHSVGDALPGNLPGYARQQGMGANSKSGTSGRPTGHGKTPWRCSL